jgi:hypothetical protein
MRVRKSVMGTAMSMVLALGLFSSGAGVASDFYNEEPTSGEMFADAFVARPLTLVASVAGAAAWVLTLPFTLPSGSAGDTGKAWVMDPLEYTFVRPVGEMGEEGRIGDYR